MGGNNKVKHRTKNLTEGYVLIMQDRAVKFGLYTKESEKTQS